MRLFLSQSLGGSKTRPTSDSLCKLLPALSNPLPRDFSKRSIAISKNPQSKASTLPTKFSTSRIRVAESSFVLFHVCFFSFFSVRAHVLGFILPFLRGGGEKGRLGV